MLLFCLPLSAMSRLKSPHNAYMWLGCEVIWLVLSVLRCGMRHVSSKCVRIYICMINHGVRGWLFIFIICSCGKMLAGVEILLTFPRNAYLLWINVSRPPLPGV